MHILKICVKQLSTQSENDSNKGVVMAEFQGFNQFFVFEWDLIEEARLQNYVA